MVLLKIISEQNGVYELKKKNNLSPTYKLIIDFYGVEKPFVGSTILMHENLLNKRYEGYAQPYFFEYYMEYEDNKIVPVEGTEYIVLHDDKKSIIMKRIYG